MTGTPIRILYLSATSRLGGAEISLLTLLGALERTQVESVLAAPDDGGSLLSEARNLGCRIETVPLKRLRRTLFSLLAAGATIRRCRDTLAQVVSECGIDLVHANSPPAALYAPRNAPLLLHCRDLRVHWGYGLLLRRHLAAVAAPSTAVGEVAAERFGPIVHRIANSVDPAFTPGAADAREDVLVMVGHLLPWKRHKGFLECLARVRVKYPSMRGIVAGANLFGEHRKYAEALKRRTAELELTEAVTWLGEVPREDMPALLARARVLVHPAPREPFGRVVIEALACGTPVVAVDAAGPGEILRDGGGTLVPDFRGHRLAAAVLRILDDPRRARALAEAGRNLVESRYGAVKHARTLTQLYRDLLGRATSR